MSPGLHVHAARVAVAKGFPHEGQLDHTEHAAECLLPVRFASYRTEPRSFEVSPTSFPIHCRDDADAPRVTSACPRFMLGLAWMPMQSLPTVAKRRRRSRRASSARCNSAR